MQIALQKTKLFNEFIVINKIPHNARGGVISYNLSERDGSTDTATEVVATTKSKNKVKINSEKH